MSKWIKNTSGSNKTYLGQLINNGEYYQIQTQEEALWAEHSPLLVDIAATTVLVAKDDSGNNDIIDFNEALKYLKGLLPTIVRDSETTQYEELYSDVVTTILGSSEKAKIIETPSVSEKIIIKEFQTTAPYDPNAIVLLVWDYDTGNEQELLIGWGNDRFRPQNMELQGDGSKKLAIVLVNGGLADGVRLAGLVKYNKESV